MPNYTRSRMTSLLAVGLLGLTLAACGEEAEPATSSTPGASEDGDTGATIPMWSRATTAVQSQALVDAYNASHENQVELTVVPTENYLQKVGVAAGANQLPCLLASDVVYAPSFISKNLYLDITDRIDGLEFADTLAPAHMTTATEDDKKYAVPHTIGMSAIFQNNVLLEQAGIDPEVQVATLDELAENAAKVAALGPDKIGLYYTGNAGGTLTFTHFPSIWADGGEPISEDGMEARLDSPESVAVFEAYNQMFKDGVTPDSVRNETGATRNSVFGTGTVGYVLSSNAVLETVPESETVKIGIQGIPGTQEGSDAVTFLGGDVLGISASCENEAEAWDFLAWSVGDEAQVDVYAARSQLTLRTDLADNEFAVKDPRIARLNELVAEGRTPFALRYGETFNDPNGPWLTGAREALFGDDPEAALQEANEAVSASLSQ